MTLPRFSPNCRIVVIDGRNGDVVAAAALNRLGYATALASSPDTLSFLPDPSTVLIVRVENQRQLLGLAPILRSFAHRWIALVDAAIDHLASETERLGAAIAISDDLPTERFFESLVGAVVRLSAMNASGSVTRVLSRGQAIDFATDHVIEVESGVLSQAVIHPDGARVLLGMIGAGNLVVSHPPDNCGIVLGAHCDATVRVRSWYTASLQPDFPVRLLSGLRQMEAWAAMQARPYFEERLLGILSLLAEQFGVPHDAGTLIDLRMTHTDIASAIGATRTTVTRLIGELRRASRIAVVRTGAEDRFVIGGTPSTHHGIPSVGQHSLRHRGDSRFLPALAALPDVQPVAARIA